MARSRELKKPDETTSQKVRPTTEFQDGLDLIRSRAGLLTGKDRAIMQIYLDNGVTFKQMARIAGVNEVCVARRIHKLVKRLLDGQYITCLRNRHKFTSEELDIARDYFLGGLPMSRIAENRSATYYTVRRAMKKMQRLTKITEDGGRKMEAKRAQAHKGISAQVREEENGTKNTELRMKKAKESDK